MVLPTACGEGRGYPSHPQPPADEDLRHQGSDGWLPRAHFDCISPRTHRGWTGEGRLPVRPTEGQGQTLGRAEGTRFYGRRRRIAVEEGFRCPDGRGLRRNPAYFFFPSSFTHTTDEQTDSLGRAREQHRSVRRTQGCPSVIQ